MTFPINTNVPGANNNPSTDQQPMQTNFSNINSYLGVDHTAPGTNPGDGQHNQVTFHTNQAAPSITNGVSGLYANIVSALSQLFFQNSGGSVQLTGLTVTTSGNNFGVTTPWGLIFNFGSVLATVAGTPITFAIPMSTAQYALVLGSTTNTTIYHTGFNSGGATIRLGSGGAAAAYYFAVGK